MPTYHNQLYDFEIDFPDDWKPTKGLSRFHVYLATVVNGADITEEYSNGHQEWINIVLEIMHPEITPDIAELLFIINAIKLHYTDIVFSRIHIADRDHACVTYLLWNGMWLKKYMIVLNGMGYALTASCPYARKSQIVEEQWDRIASSFRLLHPMDEAIRDFNQSIRVQQLLEQFRQNLKEDLQARTSVIHL
jgi:hypothetical protein